MKLIRRDREPTTPGEILQEEFLTPLGISQRDLAERLDVETKAINRIVNGRVGVTPRMALLLAQAFDTTADFWMRAQQAVDLYKARCLIKSSGLKIKKFKVRQGGLKRPDTRRISR